MLLCCVSIPALALQLVLRAHPEWSSDPVVVVEDDRPLASILWCNRVARSHRIRRGMSFAQARALSAVLHVQVVPEQAIEAAIDALFELLLSFSPSIEPSLEQPGLFWLDPRGLHGLFGELERWAARVHDALHAERYV
ncbi:MAG: DNA polymerase Y family protein, partial [Polyangiales bacterium]